MLVRQNATDRKMRSVLRLLTGLIAGSVVLNPAIVRGQGTSAPTQPQPVSTQFVLDSLRMLLNEG